MTSTTTLSDHFGFSSVYPGFCQVVYMRPQWSHTKSGYIFENLYVFCVKWRVLQHSQLISDFRVYTQDFVYTRPQWSHSKSGYIFEKIRAPTFSASNSKCYNFLSSFWIFECIPRILCIWDPSDHIVQVDTYLKSLTVASWDIETGR